MGWSNNQIDLRVNADNTMGSIGLEECSRLAAVNSEHMRTYGPTNILTLINIVHMFVHYRHLRIFTKVAGTN